MNAATPLPAVSLRKKGRALGSPRICRILPLGDSESAGKNRDRPARHRFCASVTCGFVGKNRVALGDFRFFPALTKKAMIPSALKQRPLRILLENNHLNAKTAFRRFPRTKPDVTSQGLITTRTLRKSPIPINHYSDKGQPWGAKPKYLRTSGTSRMSLIRVLAVIDCCDAPFSQREAVGFETPNSDSNSC